MGYLNVDGFNMPTPQSRSLSPTDLRYLACVVNRRVEFLYSEGDL